MGLKGCGPLSVQQSEGKNKQKKIHKTHTKYPLTVKFCSAIDNLLHQINDLCSGEIYSLAHSTLLFKVKASELMNRNRIVREVLESIKISFS